MDQNKAVLSTYEDLMPIMCPVLENPEFIAISNNEDRIKYLINVVSKNDRTQTILDSQPIDKSVEVSIDFREQGNKLFNTSYAGNSDTVIELYTKSLAHAPEGSREQSLAYANRSAALLKARLISDCLLDINRAFEIGYPDELKAKLYLRKAMCLQILNPKNPSESKEALNKTRNWIKKMDPKNQKILEEQLQMYEENKSSFDKSIFRKCKVEKYQPDWKAKNTLLPGLSDAIEIKYSTEFGRHIVATRDIKPGEILGRPKPYAKILHLKMRYKFCWNCGQQTWSGLPSKKSSQVIYCSEKCRDNDNDDKIGHHHYECNLLGPMIGYKMQEGTFITLKVILKAIQEVGYSIDELKKNLESMDASFQDNSLTKGFTNGFLDPTKFSSVYCLSSNRNNLIVLADCIVLSHIILLAYLFATKTELLGKTMSRDLNILKDDKNFIFFVEFLLKITRLVMTNVFEIGTRCIKTNERVGIFQAVTPAASFFNHSCSCMVARNLYEDLMSFTALRPIKRGEQVFDNYGIYYNDMPKEKRQEILLKNYCFECKCEACKNNWPVKGIVTKVIPHFTHMQMAQKFKALFKKLDALENGAALFSVSRKMSFHVCKDIADYANVFAEICHTYETNSQLVVVGINKFQRFLNFTEEPYYVSMC